MAVSTSCPFVYLSTAEVTEKSLSESLYFRFVASALLCARVVGNDNFISGCTESDKIFVLPELYTALLFLLQLNGRMIDVPKFGRLSLEDLQESLRKVCRPLFLSATQKEWSADVAGLILDSDRIKKTVSAESALLYQFLSAAFEGVVAKQFPPAIIQLILKDTPEAVRKLSSYLVRQIEMKTKADALSDGSADNTVAHELGLTAAIHLASTNLHGLDCNSYWSTLPKALKRIRTWFDGADGISLDGVGAPLAGATATLFHQLIERKAEIDINMAGFITGFSRRLMLYSKRRKANLRYGPEHRKMNSDSTGNASGYSPVFALRLLTVLTSNNEDVVKAAYRLLEILISRDVQALSIQVEMHGDAAMDTDSLRNFYALLSSLDTMASGAHSQSIVFKYHVCLMLVFKYFENATFDLRQRFIAELQQKTCIQSFMESLVITLDVGHSGGKPFDLSKWEIESFLLEAFDLESDAALKILVAHLYLLTLKSTPTLVRDWWSSCKNRQVRTAVESYTERFFSPLLTSREAERIAATDQSIFEEMTVKTSKAGNEITACYEVDETSINIVIRLPSNYPLSKVEVDSGSGGRVVGITEARWRSWLLNISILAQNASIIEALNQFKKNVKLHFEGVEDCSICYSVIGVIDKTLPSKTCRTCKNVFHASLVIVDFLQIE
ncbi:hypothetical protein HK101_000211 [Irineochytrium annulatum]|nr:hypothetical protein HK101_000211 [Irineochytrium annulatum]